MCKGYSDHPSYRLAGLAPCASSIFPHLISVGPLERTPQILREIYIVQSVEQYLHVVAGCVHNSNVENDEIIGHKEVGLSLRKHDYWITLHQRILLGEGPVKPATRAPLLESVLSSVDFGSLIVHKPCPVS